MSRIATEQGKQIEQALASRFILPLAILLNDTQKILAGFTVFTHQRLCVGQLQAGREIIGIGFYRRQQRRQVAAAIVIARQCQPNLQRIELRAFSSVPQQRFGVSEQAGSDIDIACGQCLCSGL